MKAGSIYILLFLLVLAACAPKGNVRPYARPFPSAEVPLMVEDPSERLSWLVQHFWDRFTAADSLYLCDSLHLNGVSVREVEKQMGIFAHLLQQASPEDGIRSMERLYRQAEAFQCAHPDAPLFADLNALVNQYFYDPNSPLRNEDLYGTYALRLADSPLLDSLSRERAAREARLCALNRPGTPAADFVFIDSQGRKRSLYALRAERLLLIFGHPDCHACQELQEAFSASKALSRAIDSGELLVVDIYIDQDIDSWKRHIPDYPAAWINGYDPGHVIRTELLYSVRALPSLYLLDARKTVLLKDCTPQQLFASLGL